MYIPPVTAIVDCWKDVVWDTSHYGTLDEPRHITKPQPPHQIPLLAKWVQTVFVFLKILQLHSCNGINGINQIKVYWLHAQDTGLRLRANPLQQWSALSISISIYIQMQNMKSKITGIVHKMHSSRLHHILKEKKWHQKPGLGCIVRTGMAIRVIVSLLLMSPC